MPIRKAGDLIREAFRENTLNTNRATPIGSGSNGVVYASDQPGYVIKELNVPDGSFRSLEDEANLQSIGAQLGIAPQVAGLEKFPGGVGNRLEMQDIRTNYEPVRSEGDAFGAPGVGSPIDPRVNIQTAQQLGQLALNGVRLEDRRGANIVQNRMTGRPMQIDFGIAGRVTGSEQAATLANATAEGFEAAGLGEMASIYRATVMDLLEGGDVADAMDVAKQGFSRLQKLRGPIS